MTKKVILEDAQGEELIPYTNLATSSEAGRVRPDNTTITVNSEGILEVDQTYLVHTDGNETIEGTKTFSNTISGSINGNAATVTNGVYTTGNQTIEGTKTFRTSPVVPTPATDSNNTQVATTAWVNTKVQSNNQTVVHLTKDETIGGTKTFSNTISGSINGNAATVTNGVYTTGNQTIEGTKTFSNTISGSINGNAATVTNGVYTTGNQTIEGTKTFRTSPVVPTPAVSSNTTVPATTAYVNNKFQLVSAKPASADANTFYFIPES